jgi:hypothetical protein
MPTGIRCYSAALVDIAHPTRFFANPSLPIAPWAARPLSLTVFPKLFTVNML